MNNDEIKKSYTANCTTGDRHIVVLDRGWIFVGNLSLDKGIYTITNCKNVRKWRYNGFGGLTRSATFAKTILDDCTTLKFHRRALIFCVPVSDDWETADV